MADAAVSSVDVSSISPDVFVDRPSAIWRYKYAILTSAVAVGLIVAGVSSLLPPTYSASALVRVTAQASSGISPQEVALASNQLASQFAILANTADVKTEAAKQLSDGASGLTVSATTVAGENLIQISTTADKQAKAEERVKAVSSAFVVYIASSSDARVAGFGLPLQPVLDDLQGQIDQARADVTALSGASALSAEGQTLDDRIQRLSTLEARQYELQKEIALKAAVKPSVELVSTSGASKTSPKPLVYTVVAVVVALIVSAEIGVRVMQRRFRRPPQK